MIKSEDVGADEICNAVYTIEKRRREALLLHLGRCVFLLRYDAANLCLIASLRL